jgi:hypothetical protein
MGRLAIVGRAQTHGQRLPLGVDDPVIAARAVRRALAAASRRAADVSTVVVASSSSMADDALLGFTRRALGPHGSNVHVAAVSAGAPDAEHLADVATAELGALLMAEDHSGVGIAVGLGADGTTVAHCLAISKHRASEPF